MFEINDIVKYRVWDWPNIQYETHPWKVIEVNRIDLPYGEYDWSYIIENLETGEIKEEISWIQITHFENR